MSSDRTSAWRYSGGVDRAAIGSVFDDGWVAGPFGVSLQRVKKLISRVENRAEPAGRSISFDLLLAFLPLRCPVPSLIGITLGARSKQNAIVDDFSLELVAVVQARGKPKFLRQCHPPIDGEPRQHHVITIPVLDAGLLLVGGSFFADADRSSRRLHSVVSDTSPSKKCSTDSHEQSVTSLMIIPRQTQPTQPV